MEHFAIVLSISLQGSETQVDTRKTHLKNPERTHPKFNPVMFLVLLITKDFIMFKIVIKVQLLIFPYTFI